MWNFLAWKNRFEGPLTQDLELSGDYDPIVFPDDTTPVTILMTLNQAQFTRIYSALIKGAILSYPDQYEQVAWDFLKAFEMPIDLCQAIADCINDPTSPARQAVKELVTTDPDINEYITNIVNNVAGNILSELERGQNLLKPGACDYDYTFNEASTFVFLLDQLSTDLFQAIAVGLTALERAEQFVSAIPVIGGLLPFDEIIGLASDLVTGVSTAYAGAYDQGLYDDLRCGLFCTFKDTCGLSIDEAMAFYEDKLGSSLPSNPLETLTAILEYIATGTIGDSAVYAMHLLVIAAIRAGTNLLGVDFGQLGLRITAAGDEPDNDWETLCEECAPLELWELVSCGFGTVTQLSGPEIGVGTYSFRFNSTYWGGGGLNLGDYRWGNSSQQFVVNTLTVSIPGSPHEGGFGAGVGTPYHRDPGSVASCAAQAGLIGGLPIADGETFYGGIAGTTFVDYPWQIIMNITVSEIPE